MLNINDDMDDLMRQAANDYPLRTGGADWEKVAAGIQGGTPPPPSEGDNRRWLLLLLLLLPAMLIVLHQKQRGTKAPSAANTTLFTQNSRLNNDAAVVYNDSVKMGANRRDTGAAVSSTNKTTRLQKIETNIRVPRAHSAAARLHLPPAPELGNIENNRHKMSLPPHKNGLSKNNKTNANGANSGGLPEDAARSSNTPEPGVFSKNDSSDRFPEKSVNPLATAPLYNNADSSSMPRDEYSVKQTKNAKQQNTKRKGLYAGLAAGMDITTIKFKKIYTPGYTVAFLAGYRLNNHWSLESGVQWDHKNYYSPGKYFDKTNTGISPTSYIYYIEGTCRMLEVPLNVKFDFNSKHKSGFFVVAGLSSYFMKNEDYEYHATNNGNYYVGHKTYKNSTNNLFSVVNVSGGYQVVFKQNSSLRVEPYIKMPLRGLGIGKLPFESTGIAVAYTLPLQ